MLNLTDQETAMLAGEEGVGVRRAMQIVRALAEAAGAERLVEVESAQISGVSYKNIGDAGLEFLERWAGEGTRARVSAWMNPCGADLRAWEELGYRPDFIERQRRVVDALCRLGVSPALTCAPYHDRRPPARGARLAWSESSAVSVANSVFGARTNREGGPSALAAAICGRTPLSGYQLDQNRRPTHRVEVNCPLGEPSDFGALGALVGAQVGDGVPSFARLDTSGELDFVSCMKQLAAAMAASGAVALFHVDGFTPEAADLGKPEPGLPVIGVDDLAPARRRLTRPGKGLDLVALGCPHLSMLELKRVAKALGDRRPKAPLWLCVSRQVAEESEALGALDKLRQAGARVVCDTCLVVAPLSDLGIKHVATNSAKSAIYAAMHGEGGVYFGTLEECVEAAVRGAWEHGGDAPQRLSGRAIVSGEARGELLCTTDPVSFYGGVDPETGLVRDPGHPLRGQSVAGKVLAFPGGKGSTVGSYVIYALKRNGVAPAALLVEKADAIVAAGAVIAGIPMVSDVAISRLPGGRAALVRGGEVEVE